MGKKQQFGKKCDNCAALTSFDIYESGSIQSQIYSNLIAVKRQLRLLSSKWSDSTHCSIFRKSFFASSVGWIRTQIAIGLKKMLLNK